MEAKSEVLLVGNVGSEPVWGNGEPGPAHGAGGENQGCGSRRRAFFGLALSASYSKRLRGLVTFQNPRWFSVSVDEAEGIALPKRDDLVIVRGTLKIRAKEMGAEFEVEAREILRLEPLRGRHGGRPSSPECGADSETRILAASLDRRTGIHSPSASAQIHGPVDGPAHGTLHQTGRTANQGAIQLAVHGTLQPTIQGTVRTATQGAIR